MTHSATSCQAALFTLFLAASCGFGQATQSATAPGLPLTIDKVVNPALITLQTKGKAPQEAFAMLAKETGVVIVAGKRQNRGQGNGGSSPIDLWKDRVYAPVDFDLEGVTFWQGMDRLLTQAKLQTYQWEHGRFTLLPSAIFPEQDSDCGAVRVRLKVLRLGTKDGTGTTIATRGSALVRLDFDEDPRIRILAAGEPKIEARDAGDHVLAFQTEVGLNPSNGSGVMQPQIKLTAQGPEAANLANVRGYLPVTVVTEFKEVEVPMKAGVQVKTAGWVVDVVDVNEKHSQIEELTNVELAIRRAEGSLVAVPPVIDNVVEVRDAANIPLARATWNVGVPRDPAVEGAQWLHFEWSHDQDAATPAKMVVVVPTVVKAAIVAFEFKDVDLPRN